MFFIAEMSGNHNGSRSTAMRIVEEAAKSGSTHLKIQTYTPETITLDIDHPAYKVKEGHQLWGGKSLHELYRRASTPYEWHESIFRLSRDLGMTPFSTPFDEEAVDFLESLGAPLYKIASLEIVDLPLIQKCAGTGKPLIISTGTATLEEVEEAVIAARDAGCADLTLLVCTSDYPADPSLANLARIPFLKSEFKVKVGLSDHTIGTHVAMAAIALGAEVIEKHFTLARDDGGVDSGFSATPTEYARLVTEGMEVLSSIGSAEAWGLAGESQSRSHRPSIIAVRDIEVGEILDISMVKTLRPNVGLPPKEMPKVIGSRTIKKVSKGDGISWSHIAV